MSVHGPGGPGSTERWTRDDWSGATVLTLALGVIVVLVVLSLGTAFGSFEPQAAGMTTVAGVVGAIVGSVATFIGGHSKRAGGE